MSNRILSGALVALLSFVAFNRAPAATIDTFDFTDDTGWVEIGQFFTGTFTAQVEPDGLVDLADLISFTASMSSLNPTEHVLDLEFTLTKANLVNFFYDPGEPLFPGGDPTTLQMVAAVPNSVFTFGGTLVCVGSATLVSPCNPFGLNPPPGVTLLTGVAIVAPGFGPVAGTSDTPVITLVSSVTTIPEAPTWAMMLLGFAGLGFAGYRAQRGWAAARIRG